MCESCDALRQEFAEDIIRRRLRLTPAEARIVCALHRSEFYRPDYRNEDSARVLLGRIREVIGHDMIETVRLKGYRLTDTGRKRVAQVLEIAA